MTPCRGMAPSMFHVNKCDDVAWICDDVVKLQIIHLIILVNTFCKWMKK
jgi:hypothetical protein